VSFNTASDFPAGELCDAFVTGIAFFSISDHMGTQTMVLHHLGIFGWSARDENLVLAPLLTGGPLLLIGDHRDVCLAHASPPMWQKN
jgi:hypothetical protein